MEGAITNVQMPKVNGGVVKVTLRSGTSGHESIAARKEHGQVFVDKAQ
jgi:hypothetical protein